MRGVCRGGRASTVGKAIRIVRGGEAVLPSTPLGLPDEPRMPQRVRKPDEA